MKIKDTDSVFRKLAGYSRKTFIARYACFLAAVGLLGMLPLSANAAGRIRLPEPVKDGDFQRLSFAEFELGRMLFFDKELSGNRNISCATCHSPLIATVDGLSTNLGTGGRGFSVLRDAGNFPPGERDPLSRASRNMTPLFNLGHKQFDTLFWDGRIEVDASLPYSFVTPAGDDLPTGFDSALAALSVFAQTDSQEMLGEAGTNELADAALIHSQTAVWSALVLRLGQIPEYVELFTAAYPEVASNPVNMNIVQVGNALGAYQAVNFRSDNSPFDQFLRGDRGAMSLNAIRGAIFFYGKAGGCATCHSGPFQTDLDFHAIAMPQVGPGFGDGYTGREDFGREGFSQDPEDRYKFRTPSLRNVALTGPWGHDGAFNSLRAVVEHHLNPVLSLESYDSSQIVMPSRSDLDELDLIAHNDPTARQALIDANELAPRSLSESNIDYLIEFLHALTDSSATDLRADVPMRVPSGLPLAEIR